MALKMLHHSLQILQKSYLVLIVPFGMKEIFYITKCYNNPFINVLKTFTNLQRLSKDQQLFHDFLLQHSKKRKDKSHLWLLSIMKCCKIKIINITAFHHHHMHADCKQPPPQRLLSQNGGKRRHLQIAAQ